MEILRWLFDGLGTLAVGSLLGGATAFGLTRGHYVKQTAKSSGGSIVQTVTNGGKCEKCGQ